MVTILIHISDETAEALAEWKPLHEKGVAELKSHIDSRVGHHPDTCTDATCPELVYIEDLKETLRHLECVSRFVHDLVGATKCAKASA